MLKKALITGASGGIGRSLALSLARRGYDIAIHYRSSESEADEVCRQARNEGVDAFRLSADLCDPDAAREMVAQTYEALGGLNVLINNVGNWISAKTSELTVKQWQEALDSNLNTTFYVTQAALPYMLKSSPSRIVNFAAARAQHVVAHNDNTAYMIAKTGIIIYSKSLAKELANQSVTVNVIAPGIAETSFEYSAAWQGILPDLPTGRPARLEELADAAWFFIKPESQYVTGQVLEVSGGWGL